MLILKNYNHMNMTSESAPHMTLCITKAKCSFASPKAAK